MFIRQLSYESRPAFVHTHTIVLIRCHVFVSVENYVAVFVSRKDGQRLARLVDSGVRVYMRIGVGAKQEHRLFPGPTTLNKTSVLFVSVSFIVLMLISLAWLAFYYIQRFRYSHAKERLTVRVCLSVCLSAAAAYWLLLLLLFRFVCLYFYAVYCPCFVFFGWRQCHEQNG